MRTVACSAVILAIFLAARPSPAQTPPSLSIRDLMSADEFRAAGLEKLTPDEMRNLNSWLVGFALRVAGLGLTQPLGGAPSTRTREYLVEASVKDETFIINGEVFEAKTFCFGVQSGDKVIFTQGSPLGVCVSAEFVVLRTGNKCSCWCK